MERTKMIKTQQDYNKYVKQDLAAEVIRLTLEAKNIDEIYDFVHEVADDACIYYADCHKIMEFTENPNALSEHGMELPSQDLDWDQITTQYAYWAVYQDILDTLDHDRIEAAVEYLNERAERKAA